VIARVLEASGLPTTSISLVREHTEKLKVPRALFVPFPFGHPFGRPNDQALQHRVLRAALDLFAEPGCPVLRDFPDEEAAEEGPPAAIQASQVEAAPPAEDAADETTRMRHLYERWVAREGRTAVGLTRIPPQRFRGVIRFLEAFAAGEEADMRERPAEIPLPLFIRYCADDLKAMYFEARLVEQPRTTGAAFARWFWGETATGQLIRRVKERLDTADDPLMKAAAYGIAR